MKKWCFSLLAIVGLCFVLLGHRIERLNATPLNSLSQWAQSSQASPLNKVLSKPRLWYYPPGVPTAGCAVTPDPTQEIRFTRGTLNLSRFRRPLQASRWPSAAPAWLREYRPPEEVALAHPTNFGERFQRDITGQSAARRPVIVLHETVISGWRTVRFFQTAHPSSGQASYHALIKRDGTIFYIVPPDKRAFGAGDSIFYGRNGSETTRTSRRYPPSVNNFAYHVSLETPPDGDNNANFHSGYSDVQYASLAWLVAKTGIPADRITTHQGVDRSGSRKDPRSFDQAKFNTLVSLIPKTNEITVGCWRY